jgi:hypothetical protein
MILWRWSVIALIDDALGLVEIDLMVEAMVDGEAR